MNNLSATEKATNRGMNGRTLITTLFVLTAVLLFIPLAKATDAFEGIDFVDIVIKDTHYSVPVGNLDRKNEIYYIKKALEGDKVAREIFLGGQKERLFFIGIETPLWLKITENSQEVVKP